MGEFTYGELVFMVLFSFASIMLPGMVAGLFWQWKTRKPRSLRISSQRRLEGKKGRKAA